MDDRVPASTHACGGCADSRRDFLRQAAAIVAAVVAETSGLAAHALPVHFGAPGIRDGEEFSYPVPVADGATIDRDNAIILVRFEGRIFAFNLSCPHENAAVRWKAALGRFECSRHDSKYLPDGQYISGRATRNLDRFPVRKNGSSVVVDVSTMIQSDQNKAAWDAAFVPA